MSKADLKAAMNSLQVNKPLRLQDKSPVFKPPIPVTEHRGDSNPVAISTQGLILSEVPVAANTQPLRNSDEVRPSIPGQISIQGSNTSQDENQPRDSFDSGISGQINRSSQPRKATAQDEAVLGANKSETGLSRGYTRVPNSLLMRLVGGTCSKHEMQVLLFVARMTISFRRELAPISKSVIEKFTGIRGSAATHSVTGLEEAGLIQRIPGDERRPSRIGLKLDTGWDWLRSDSDSAHENQSSKNLGSISTQGSFQSGDSFSPRDQINPASLGIFAPTRNNIEINNKKENTLSQLTGGIRRYFDDLRPQRKRESELNAFEEIRRDFSIQDIEASLEHIRKNGLPGGEICHSPMAYLASAMSEVLAIVRVEQEKHRVRAENVARVESERLQAAETEDRELREQQVREAAFNRVFCEEARQREVIAELCLGTAFRPNSVLGRMYAISTWWKRFEKQEGKS